MLLYLVNAFSAGLVRVQDGSEEGAQAPAYISACGACVDPNIAPAPADEGILCPKNPNTKMGHV
jgi:hypothetical protein